MWTNDQSFQWRHLETLIKIYTLLISIIKMIDAVKRMAIKNTIELTNLSTSTQDRSYNLFSKFLLSS